MSNLNWNYRAANNQYLQQQAKTASPEKLILMLYDIGLRSCHNKDREKAAKVLVELITALNFDYKEISLTFFDLYRFALDQVHNGRFDNAIMVFEGLRAVWQKTVLGKSEDKN